MQDYSTESSVISWQKLFHGLVKFLFLYTWFIFRSLNYSATCIVRFLERNLPTFWSPSFIYSRYFFLPGYSSGGWKSQSISGRRNKEIHDGDSRKICGFAPHWKHFCSSPAKSAQHSEPIGKVFYHDWSWRGSQLLNLRFLWREKKISYSGHEDFSAMGVRSCPIALQR